VLGWIEKELPGPISAGISMRSRMGIVWRSRDAHAGDGVAMIFQLHWIWSLARHDMASYDLALNRPRQIRLAGPTPVSR
jgi:hypothetical protein